MNIRVHGKFYYEMPIAITIRTKILNKKVNLLLYLYILLILRGRIKIYEVT
jgi:hypothetical protein